MTDTDSSVVNKDDSTEHAAQVVAMPKTNFSIVNLEDTSKLAIALIDKVSEAVGGIARPYQETRVAKAEAKAAIIRAEAGVEVAKAEAEEGIIRAEGEAQAKAKAAMIQAESDIEVARRDEALVASRPIKQQANIEGITYAALSYLNSDAAPQDVEDDWVTNFFDKCHNISDKEMRQVWARILAGEANKPGSFSRKTVNVMADLDKADAELFRNLCRFGWTHRDDGLVTPLVFDYQDGIYNQNNVYFGSCNHLEYLGLINKEFRGFAFARNEAVISYNGRTVRLTSTDNAKQINMGHIVFTRTGLELYRICQVEPVDGFFEYVCDVWTREHGLTITPVADAR